MLAKGYRITGAECIVLSAVLFLFWPRVQISSFPQVDVGGLEPAQLCRCLRLLTGTGCNRVQIVNGLESALHSEERLLLVVDLVGCLPLRTCRACE